MSHPLDRLCSRTSVARVGLVLVWIMSISSLSDVFAADGTSVQIKVDQVGYLPDSELLATRLIATMS